MHNPGVSVWKREGDHIGKINATGAGCDEVRGADVEEWCDAVKRRGKTIGLVWKCGRVFVGGG